MCHARLRGVTFWVGLLSIAVVAAVDPPAVAAADAPAAERSPHEKEIRELIGRLAISDEAASKQPVLTPAPDAPKSDKRVISTDAYNKLKEYGIEAFPLLVESLGDKRQAACFMRALPCDVGAACFSIMRDQLFPSPAGYRGSFYRTGKDGKNHERPVYMRELVTPANIADWLNARRGKSLVELQIEALAWELGEEERIGAATPDDEQAFLAPLRAKLDELNDRVAANRDEVAQEAGRGVPLQEIHKNGVEGRLGVRLGTIVVVGGTVVKNTSLNKADSALPFFLSITSVDGRNLPKPVLYPFSNAATATVNEPKIGDRFRYVGYETGGFHGPPPGEFEYVPAYATTGFGFGTHFSVLAVK